MRHSPSVHNALVLNLRSGDAHLDVRGRSPHHPFSISLALSHRAVRKIPPRLLVSFPLLLVSLVAPLSRSCPLAPLAQAADGVTS